MSNVKYVLDANVFINMQRHHPLDVFGSLWAKMADAIDSGSVISCSEVFDELSKGDDDLIKWAKLRKAAFLTSGVSACINPAGAGVFLSAKKTLQIAPFSSAIPSLHSG